MTGIYTLDAVIAILIAFMILTSAVVMLSAPKKQGSQKLYAVTSDLLAVAEKNGGLAGAVDGEYGKIDLMKTVVPAQTCFKLTIRNITDDIVYSDDTGCQEGKDTVIVRRVLAHRESLYTAEMRAWLR